MKKLVLILIITTILIGGIIFIFNLINPINNLSKNDLTFSLIEDEIATSSSSVSSKKTTKTTITTNKVTTTKSITISTKNEEVKTSSTKKTTSTTKTTSTKIVETEKTTTKKESPWEKFGLTEDEYYNKPVFKWERVDFAVEDYGSEKATREACLKYGDSYPPYLNGEVAYICSYVISMSGRYLGEMFLTEDLN